MARPCAGLQFEEAEKNMESALASRIETLLANSGKVKPESAA